MIFSRRIELVISQTPKKMKTQTEQYIYINIYDHARSK